MSQAALYTLASTIARREATDAVEQERSRESRLSVNYMISRIVGKIGQECLDQGYGYYGLSLSERQRIAREALQEAGY